MHTKDILFSFVKEIAPYCVDLRLDNLNWMTVADLRRLLSNFRLIVCFHTGNVSLSKSTLIKDIKILFPFIKSINLLISLDANVFEDLCASLNQINQLEHISMVLVDKKGKNRIDWIINFLFFFSIGGCLSDLNIRLYLRLVSEYISTMTGECKLVSIEENGYGIEHSILLNDIPREILFEPITLSLISTLKHLIVSFRPMLNLNLTLKLKDSTNNKLPLQTLVLPCLPDSIDILDLRQLTILDIGYINVKNRIELKRLDEILLSHRYHSLRNLTINLNEWQPARLIVVRGKQTTSEFSSVFENCFDEISSTPEEEVNHIIDEFSLEFIDQTQSTIFQLPLNYSWLNKLTNLNLTGIHCHSIDFQYIFNSLYLLRSLSLSPCLLFYINQIECHCQTSIPYQFHSLNRNLLSLNLVFHPSNSEELCSMFLDQYKLHCIRHSSIHQYLNSNESLFQYKHLIRYSIRTIFQTLDLHHLSIRIPEYDLHIDDLDIPKTNHLQSLILDVRIPMTFHTKLARLYSKNSFNNLRRFILISESSFELTPILIDRFRSLEIIEIISVNNHLNRSTIHYLETVLKPMNYPNLNTFRLWIGSVDAKHLIKHAQKTIRTAFAKVKPAFQFDISLVNSSRQCILYDSTHEIHRDFHSLLSIHSNQLSIVYPRFLNYKSLYSEQKFDK